MTPPNDEYVIDFPALWVALEWIEHHCVIPDGFRAGEPFIMPSWQGWFMANHYRIKPTAKLFDRAGNPVPAVGAPAFHYRRSQLVMPQKSGKGPLIAAQVCLEGVGPALFAGWAKDGDYYSCAQHGCDCGWTYEYSPGEPMGTNWPTPLIQITAYSVEQTGNVYDALRPMIERGPLNDVIPRLGEEFIRLPGGGRIDTVTSSQRSRLGQRVTFVPQDETGIWLAQNKMIEVADTQRRGAAGMQGRTVETTNAWDPAELSVAQLTATAALTARDVFRLHRLAPAHWSYTDKRERHKIHKYVYAGSPWIDLDSIEAEAFELLGRDPAQAERFFGNRVVPGSGGWITDDLWERTEAKILVPEGAEVAGGFDGSESNDWTAIRLETRDGHRFTPLYGPDRRPTYWNPTEWGGSIPRREVHAAVDEIARRYRLRRLHCDPRDWRSEIGDWALHHGEDVVVEWSTTRLNATWAMLVRSLNDLRSGRSTHDDDPVTASHVGNARKAAYPGDRYLLIKPHDARKIDLAMADALAHEAAADLHAENAWAAKSRLTHVTGRVAAR